jgi:hypothetical protein
MSNLTRTMGDWSDEAAKQDEEAGGQSTSAFLEKLPEGDTVLRFLPPKPDQRSPFAIAHTHWFNRTDGSRGMVNCPRMLVKTFADRGYDTTGLNGFCPLCAKMEELRKSKNIPDQKKAKKLIPKLRVYANVIDRENESVGPQVFAFGKMVYDDLMKIRNNPKKGGKFTDPEKGRDIIITREGTGQNDTKYSCAASMEMSPIHPDPGQVDEWMEQAHDLSQYLDVPTAEEVIAKVKGDDEEGGEEAPARGKGARAPRPAARGGSATDDATAFDPNELDTE